MKFKSQCPQTTHNVTLRANNQEEKHCDYLGVADSMEGKKELGKIHNF